MLNAQASPSFLSEAAVDFDNTGEVWVEGGEAGFSGSPDPNPASRLWKGLVGYQRIANVEYTYLNAFAEVADFLSLSCGGVPVLDEAPESSPVLLKEPPRPVFRPLLLLEENIDVGANDICWLVVLFAPPLFVRRRRSSIPTVFFW